MQIASSITVGAINITASPHDDETYRSLINSVVGKVVSLGGSDQAMLSAPTERDGDPRILHGRICVWAEIDKKGDWFNKKTIAKASDSEKTSIIIPDEFAPNYRYFLYAIDLRRHLIIYEMKNEFRQTFGNARAERFFKGLFENISDEAHIVDITIIPEEGTVEKILAMPKLRHLKIVVTRPNPEDLSDEYAAVLQKMTDEHAKSYSVELDKAPKAERLTPNSETRKLAIIAGSNGYVEGSARGESDSTKEHAKKRIIDVSGFDSSLLGFLNAFRIF